MWNEFIFLPGIYATLLVHELGHFAAARWYHVKVQIISIGLGPEVIGATDKHGTRWKLCLLPFGAYCQLGTQFSDPKYLDQEMFSKTPIQQSIIFLAGPTFNIVFAAGLLFVANVQSVHHGTLELSEFPLLAIAGFSLLIGIFNLIPIPPLDGGRLLQLWAPCLSTSRKREVLQKSKSLTSDFVDPT